MQVDGNVTQKVKGSVTQTVSGTTTIAGDGDIDIASSGDISLAAQSINVNGKLNVTGGISSTQSISAVGNIEAGLQCYATLGMVTPGYISAGSPVALNPIPGWISGIMVTDIVRTMVMDRLIYNTHTHQGVHGMTSPPVQPM
jgi:hypothetical protein